MGVSGALRIKEKKRMKKKTEMSCVHLEWNNWSLNDWMILKFESRIPNTLMHMIPKLQLDPTVYLRVMGLQSGLICTGISENLLAYWAWTFPHVLWTWAFLHGFGLSSWAHNSAPLNGPRKSPLHFIKFRALIFCAYFPHVIFFSLYLQ